MTGPSARVAVVAIVNRQRIREKYGAGAAAIGRAVDGLLDSYRRRGIPGAVVDVSDVTTAAQLGVEAVTDVADEPATKRAVDAAYREYLPDYLVLIGGPDVLTHQHLSNPLGNNGTDLDVPSDLPYAAEAPPGGQISDFLAVTRVVGRLPDAPGARDPDTFVRVLQHAAVAPSIGAPGGPGSVFGLSAQIWLTSTGQSLAAIGSDPGTVRSSPVDGPDWDEPTMASPWHFINCHGAPAYSEFLGDPGAPVSHRATRLAGRITPGTVVAAECCYGAELFDSALTGGVDGIALTYLREGAAGYLGSTNIAYGPADTTAYADVLCAEFLRRVRAGASIGRACAEARQAYIAGTPILGPTDLKTLGQFILLGDPTWTPMPRPTDLDVRESSPESARRVRRLNIMGNGTGVGRHAAHVIETSVRPSSVTPVLPAVDELRPSTATDPTDAMAFDVVIPGDTAGIASESGLGIHVLLHRSTGPIDRIPNIVNVAVTMRGDEVISVVRAESR